MQSFLLQKVMATAAHDVKTWNIQQLMGYLETKLFEQDVLDTLTSKYLNPGITLIVNNVFVQ